MKLTESEATSRRLQDKIKELQEATRSASQEADQLRDLAAEARNLHMTLNDRLTSTEQWMEEKHEYIRYFEKQIQGDHETENPAWSQVLARPVMVKGVEDPLSDFFPGTLWPVGTEFLTVEHARQYKKLFKHDMLAESEKGRLIKLPKYVKELAKKRSSEFKESAMER